MASPSVRMRSQKTGGKIVQKPVALNERQRTRRAIHWIVDASKTRGANVTEERFAMELIRVLNRESQVLDWKAELHKAAMLNRYVAFFFSLVS